LDIIGNWKVGLLVPFKWFWEKRVKGSWKGRKIPQLKGEHG